MVINLLTHVCERVGLKNNTIGTRIQKILSLLSLIALVALGEKEKEKDGDEKREEERKKRGNDSFHRQSITAGWGRKQKQEKKGYGMSYC